MKVKFEIEIKNLIWFAVMSVLAAVLFFITEYPWWVMVGFWAVYFVVVCLKFELDEKLLWLWTSVLMLGGSVLTMFSIQYLLLEPELFAKTSDIKLFWNIVCCLAVYLLFLALFNNGGIAAAVSHVGLLCFGFINYFVYLFRGNEFSLADIRAIGTGLSVAANYKFTLESRSSFVILAAVLFVTLSVKWAVKFEQKWVARLIAFLLMIVCGIAIVLNSTGINTETWEKKGSYRNGYLLNFALQIRDSIIHAPEGYSEEVIEKLERAYTCVEDSSLESEAKEPTVIVIMNESFADLSVLGDLKTNMELTPFMDSLTENTVKGYALASVYGAKTPNSEWEYMTGNSMAFLPDGAVVYQQYISDQPTSIVSNLKNNGYTCVAMHPYYETGWRRNQIYPTLGYDEMYFIDDFDQTKLMRKYITDQEMYDKIIERFEKRGVKEKLYIMGITMQNHGGYGEVYDNFEQYVFKLGVSYTDANQYLQLIHESDAALENLITYFSNVDEPVEIVFFGDHQPGLNSKFYEVMNGKGLTGLTLDEVQDLYKVPFFIWTNYPTEAETVDITSLNYLSTMTLERANIRLPAYNQFLADMMEEIPAINSRGYYSKARERFLHIEEAAGKEAEWIKKYHILQYNNMFDKKNKSEKFFPYIQRMAEH